MADLLNVLEPDCVLIDVDAGSKKRAIEHGSELIASTHIGVNARQLFDALMARERLGSTGLGDGIAIPHCRSDAVTRIVGGLVRLAEPVAFDAPDDANVDLVFFLVVPKDAHDDHLQVLARLARIFSQPDNRALLRGAATPAALFAVFSDLLRGAPGES